MRELDDTDLEILRLLMANARRPYSDIAGTVGLSPPAVSDRVARLQEIGVINQFTLDIDRSQLRGGIPVLIDLDLPSASPGIASIKEELLGDGAVEHVFTTAEGGLIVYARVPDNDISSWLSDTLGDEAIADFEVTLLAGTDWTPELGGTDFALTCVQCGNTVDREGTTTRIDGELYKFCCPSCEARFQENYERLQQGAD